MARIGRRPGAHELLQASRGNAVAAAQLLGAVTTFRARTGAPRATVDAGPFDEAAAETRRTLGDAAWSAAFETGSTMALDAVASGAAA